MKTLRALYRTFFPLFIGLLISGQCFALTPLKGLLLGNLEDESLSKDPLPFLMTSGDSASSRSSKGSIYKAQLARYRGFFEEGENLVNNCHALGPVRYATPFEREQAKRAVLASLQYYALDHLISALAKSAVDRSVSSINFTNFVDYMVGSYCSANMTIISHRELRRQFKSRYERIQNGSYKWTTPDIRENPLFASSLGESANIDMIRDREFYIWSELFKSTCSWSGDVFNLRLMVPLVRDPVIMSHVIRSMSQLELSLNEKKNEIERVKNQNVERVYCKNLICRRASSDKEFNESFPRSIGSNSLMNDLERLYCEDLRDVDYTRREQVEQIKEIMDKRTLDEEALMKASLVGLWTGIPDLMLYEDKFNQIPNLVDLAYRREVSRWADEQIAFGLSDLTYEEPIAYEVEDRSLFWSPRDGKLKVVIDVNLGEFDRMNESIGKLSIDVPLNISESFLSWLQYEWKGSVGLGQKVRDNLTARLASELEQEINKGSEILKLELWPPQITKLVADELITQIGLMNLNPYKRDSKAKVEIPLRMNFGIFALKALRDKFLIQKSVREGDLLREDLALSLAASKEREERSSELRRQALLIESEALEGQGADEGQSSTEAP